VYHISLRDKPIPGFVSFTENKMLMKRFKSHIKVTKNLYTSKLVDLVDKYNARQSQMLHR